MNSFLSLKNTCLLCVLAVLAAVGTVFNDYLYLAFWGKLLFFLILVIALGVVTYKYIAATTVKWAMLATVAMTVVNLIPPICYDLFHSFSFDMHQYLWKGILTIVFIVVGVIGCRKITDRTERVSMGVFLAIGSVGLWLPMLIPYDAENFITGRLSFIALLPFVAYLLFFWVSLKETSDTRLRTSILLSILGCALMLAVLAITYYQICCDTYSFFDDSTQAYIWLSLIAGCLMPAYPILLFVNTKYTLKSICIPMIAGMVGLGVLSAFVIGNAGRDGWFMSFVFIIPSFGTYKFYKKL